jgi:putative component of toxin-antitoxin plasmid stabilization module
VDGLGRAIRARVRVRLTAVLQLGTKSLGEGISYARARDGARVFFRQAGNQIDILAKASKANEAKVINYLKSIY